MKLKYSKQYWDTYYDGKYEKTYKYFFNFSKLLDLYKNSFNELPISFADIGCGPGQTLVEVQKYLPDAKIYGVEIQDIPKERQVFPHIIFGDFLQNYRYLYKVDYLYVANSMYIPWENQVEFITSCVNLTNKAIYWANIYLEDRIWIPNDILRKTIYKDRKGFQQLMESLGLVKKSDADDFFVKPIK